MQGTTDELTSNFASGEGELPQIHLHLSWSEDIDVDSQKTGTKIGDSLCPIFDSAWEKMNSRYC